MGDYSPYVSFQYTFDSSHEQDGLQIHFHLTGHDSMGNGLNYDKACIAYNKAYVLGNRTPNFGQRAEQDVSLQTALMNHGTTVSTTASHDEILAAIPAQTVFCIYTHSGAGWFNACQDPSPNQDANSVTAADVQAAVANKTAAQPPFNFVHIDACWSTANSSLADAFGINGNVNDRAFLGWLTHVADNAGSEQWTQRVWANLQAGQTLTESLRLADNAGAADEWNDGDHAAVWTCFGDMYMTLHRTYYLGLTGEWHSP